MLTLQEHPDNVFLCWMIDGRKKRKIMWHPRKDPKFRLSVEDIKTFNTEKFRDKFKLSHTQADTILGHLKKSTVPEGVLQNKFFKVKRYIDNSLYSSMDLSGSSQRFQLDYPTDREKWPGHIILAAGSNSGKTTEILKMCMRAIDGPEKGRRQILWISNEFNIDKTLEPIKTKQKYLKWFNGIDVSDTTFEGSEHDTPEAFFKSEVKPAIQNLPRGSIIVYDDPCDSPIQKQLLYTINKQLRTARHKGIGIAYIVHRIRSGLWSQQAASTVKYYVLFPKSGKGKVVEFLLDHGFTRREAREIVNDYGDCDCRAMYVRLHAPQALINEELIRLF